MQVDLREFRAAYLAEVDEHLGAVNALLHAIAGRPKDQAAPRELRDLMRLLHTVKGLSAMVGIEPIVTISHRMESVLRTADRAGGFMSERALDGLIAGTRAIESRVRQVGKGEPVTEPSAALLEALRDEPVASAGAGSPGAVAPTGASLDVALGPELSGKLTASDKEQLAQGTASGRRGLLVEFAPAPAKAERGHTITTVRQRLAELGEIVRVLPVAVPAGPGTPGGLLFTILLLSDAPAAAVAEAALLDAQDVREILAPRELPVPGRPERAAVEPETALPVEAEDDHGFEAQRGGMLRVDVRRVDDAIEQLSALIVTRSRLARAVAELREAGAATRELEAIVTDNARQLRDLRAAILRVRMVPIDAVLDRLPLVIRGLGKSTGKQVRLVLDSGGAELDKSVAERIFPALVHLLRNAVDHGIEGREERLRAGKPEQATVRVTSSSHSSRQIEIRVSDDGGGVDRAAVARKAGRDVPSTDAQLLELLCRPGLSTRDAADLTSGRGVGMDIVQQIVVDGLGGELALETTAGVGTTFVLRVPLTIAIVEAFVVLAGGARYVVPVPVVEEIIEVDARTTTRGPRVRGQESRFFARRGETVPLVDLCGALGLPGVAQGGVALVVRRGRDEPVAFGIDRILGQQETVIRPLADPLVSVAGVSGTTDLGDGRATLVLDLLALCAKLGRGKDRAA
ncbi:MAG: cheA5 [Labilithrix sp.]|nr:cheA5 [Labilithrix sp.]